MGCQQSVPYSTSRMYTEKPHTLASAAETGYLQFKEQVPFQFENKISAVQRKMKAKLIKLLTPLKPRWTIPLTSHIFFGVSLTSLRYSDLKVTARSYRTNHHGGEF